MTWTKLGDEFSDEARELTDAEYRTHTEALMWSNRRLLDLDVPKADVRRFAESPGAEAAVDGLAAKGWWEDRGSTWYIGVRFAEWQLERAVVEKRRDGAAVRKRRQRLHQAGDHSLCIFGGACPAVTRPVTRDETRDRPRDETRDPGRVGYYVPSRPKSLKTQVKTKPENQAADVPALANNEPETITDGQVAAYGNPASPEPRTPRESWLATSADFPYRAQVLSQRDGQYARAGDPTMAGCWNARAARFTSCPPRPGPRTTR